MLAPTIHGRRAAGCQDQGKMLGRDESSAPAADGRLPDVAKKKAQLCKEAVRHLGFVLKKGTRLLGKSRNEVILRIPTPKTRRQVWEFLGATGFCRIWIPGYSQMAHPLCELLIGPKQSPVHWTGKQQKACDELSLALLSAPALGLPDLAKPFPL